MTVKENPASALAKKKADKLVRSLLELCSEGILIADVTLRIIEANPAICELYKTPPEKVIGADLRTLMDSKTQETLPQIFLALEEGQAWSGGVTCWISDQEPLPAKATVKRVDLNNQKLFLLVLQDPVAYKTLEERLRQEKVQTREMYITLRNVMKAIEQEKKGWEGDIAHKIEKYLLPTPGPGQAGTLRGDAQVLPGPDPGASGGPDQGLLQRIGRAVSSADPQRDAYLPAYPIRVFHQGDFRNHAHLL